MLLEEATKIFQQTDGLISGLLRQSTASPTCSQMNVCENNADPHCTLFQASLPSNMEEYCTAAIPRVDLLELTTRKILNMYAQKHM